MGQVQCKPPEIKCKPRRNLDAEADDEGVAQVTDDPDVLLTIVQRTWKKIPAQRPADAPPPDPSNVKTMIPYTFQEMATFNTSVMNVKSDGPDMSFAVEMYIAFDKLVTNINNPIRLKQECKLIGTRSTERGATLAGLEMFKSVMLASLRALLPREWSPQHEVAWSWFWQRVANHLVSNMHAAVVQSGWAKIPSERPPEASGAIPIPVTFQEMASFNMMILSQEGADMAWTSELWPAMAELVRVCGDSSDLENECYALAKNIRNHSGGTPEAFKEFDKTVFASLRSLLPHEWNSQNETAWRWFWGNVTKNVCLGLVPPTLK